LTAINQPFINAGECVNEITKLLESGTLTNSSFGGGEVVRKFEKKMAEFLGTKYAVAVSSGTMALRLALAAAGVKKGDEVIVPAYTFPAAEHEIKSLGAIPVRVDINIIDYTISYESVRKKITKKAKAIIPVHIFGNLCMMNFVKQIAADYGLKIIEDCAQSLGTTSNNKQTGTFGDYGCFSFYPTKIITTIEGGLITTKTKYDYERLLAMRNHGKAEDGSISQGTNARMTEINAVIGCSQTKQLNRFLAARRKNQKYLNDNLTDLTIHDTIFLPDPESSTKLNGYVYPIRFIDIRDLIDVKTMLTRYGITSCVYYNQKYPRDLKTTRLIAKHVLCLPIHPGVTKKDLNTIIKTIKWTMEKNV